MKSLLLIALIIFCTVNAHDHSKNKTHPTPMPPPPEFESEESQPIMYPASSCLEKNSTDDQIVCLVEIISRMQLEMAERRGMMMQWKGGKWVGVAAGLVATVILLCCAVRCCMRCRRWKRQQCNYEGENLVVYPQTGKATIN